MAAYYRHSGRFSAARLAVAVPIGIVAASALAFAYAYLFAYLPIVGYVSFLIAAGFGLLLGLGCGLLLQAAHVRNMAVAVVVTFLVTVAGYYTSWIVWVHAIAGRADVDLPIAELAKSPRALWAVIVAINENGVMTIKGWTPNGMILWIFWLIEIVLIFGPALYVGYSSVHGATYCESCNKWCKELAPLDLGEADLDELAPRVEAGDLNALKSLPARTPDAHVWTRVELKRCECHKTSTLSLSKVWLKANDKGETSEETGTVIDRLLVDRGVVEQVDWDRA